MNECIIEFVKVGDMTVVKPLQAIHGVPQKFEFLAWDHLRNSIFLETPHSSKWLVLSVTPVLWTFVYFNDKVLSKSCANTWVINFLKFHIRELWQDWISSNIWTIWELSGPGESPPVPRWSQTMWTEWTILTTKLPSLTAPPGPGQQQKCLYPFYFPFSCLKV